MVKRDPDPPTPVSRTVAFGAVFFAIVAPLVFLVILGLGSIGVVEAGRTFAPFAITATVLGLVASVWAIAMPRTRATGITTMVVMVPCVFLAAINLVSLLAPTL